MFTGVVLIGFSLWGVLRIADRSGAPSATAQARGIKQSECPTGVAGIICEDLDTSKRNAEVLQARIRHAAVMGSP